ncbi:hypothetical protein NE237_011625 [Protea cynaroides]|uniref:Nematode resistance protein-like HSPRO1 N-terminal domain-containing protein n=1 Tax=Protea cynaroides TaxID=273540 RepID=A0A9Q0JX87_9MAGN|nr:hypothetical protein NE237_011625 [Protea cynaroides]
MMSCLGFLTEAVVFLSFRSFGSPEISQAGKTNRLLALQVLGITFRLISVVQADPLLYANGFEWKRHLELITSNEIVLITLLFEDEEEAAETRGTVPVSSAINMSIINYNDDHGDEDRLRCFFRSSRQLLELLGG